MYRFNPIAALTFLSVILTACQSVTGTKEINNPPAAQQAINEDPDLSGIYQHYHAAPANRFEEEENILIEYFADHYPDALRTKSGIYYKILTQGTGQALLTGDKVKVLYHGYLADGTVFDSNYDSGKPASFQVGNMIHGWNELLLMMTPGSEVIAGIPSYLAYGAEGIPGRIAPHAVLFFRIKLL